MPTEPDAPGRDIAAATSALALLGALLLPKCPLCVVAWLSALGLGVAGAPQLGPALRVGGIALAVLGLAVCGYLARVPRRRRCRRVARVPGPDISANRARSCASP